MRRSPGKRLPLRALLADPKPLPADCGHLHKDGPLQAEFSAIKMQIFDRGNPRLRWIETIAGDPMMARFIAQRTKTEDHAEIDDIARRLWAQSR